MSQFRTLIRVAPLAVLVIAFQNCSPAKFSSTAASTADANVALGTSDTSGGDGTSGTAGTGGTTGSGGSASNGGSGSGSGHDGDCGPGGSMNGSGTAGVGGDDQQKYKDACSQLMATNTAAHVASGVNIQNHAGVIRFVAASFGTISNNAGGVAVGCSDPKGTIDSIDSDAGLTLVCGCEVKDIKHYAGKVVVVGGSIDQSEDTAGVIVVK